MTPATSEIDLGMASALYNAFYNKSSSTDSAAPSFLCPTGNCTWQPFASIATCSACHNVTDLLRRQVVEGINLGGNPELPGSRRGEWIIYSLPYANLSNLYDLRPDKFAAYMSAAVLTQPYGTVAFKHLNTMIAAAGIIKADNSYQDNITRWNETAVTATECALWFCTNA